MSGICGIFFRDGLEVPSESIKKMNDSLIHRGPDGSSIWSEDFIALAHQMLYTTPESLREKLPFRDESSGLVITADARIDNRKELSPLLNLKNETNISDSYFILKAYEKWGDNCPEHLLGDFAFAIWDPIKEQLFCARDHMGVKPFYYHLTDEFFIFGSEIKSLLTFDDVPRVFNERKVVQFLSKSFEDRETTFYESILRLPAAHSLIINSKKHELEKYWELDPTSRTFFKSDMEYSQNFLKIFKEAINCRLRSAFTLGSLLSGGLDSSSIVCVARETLLKNKGYPLKTFSTIFEETPESDERDYISVVLEKGFLEPYFTNGDENGPLLDLNPVLWNIEGPLRGAIHHFSYSYYILAQEKDIKVMLNGLGGDSTVSHGKMLPTDFILQNKWKSFFNEVNGTSKRLDKSKTRVILSELTKSCPQIFNKVIKIRKHLKQKNLFNEEFSKKINLQNNLKLDIKLNNVGKARELHYYSITTGVHQFNLEEIDKISSHFEIEPRYPFYDIRLIKYCYSIPSPQKRKNGWNRYYMRQAMTDILPSEIQWRKTKKTGGKSIYRNFNNLDKIYIESLLYENNENLKKFFNLKNLSETYKTFNKNQSPEIFWTLWPIISLGLWLNKIN